MPTPTITGGIFNFSDVYYPPTWSGVHFYIFGRRCYGVRQILADSNYIFVACENGLNIMDLSSGMPYSYITYSGGFNSIWANDSMVFLATSNSGIKYINKSCISGSTVLPFYLNCLNTYAEEPTLYSNDVRYLHGFGDLVVCCTSSGVQSLGIYGYESKTFTQHAYKCFVVSSTAIYYTLSGTYWSINKVFSSLNDWESPHLAYTADGSSVLPSGAIINDLYITEGTSVVGVDYNTVFLATSSGVVIIDEGTNETVIYCHE